MSFDVYSRVDFRNVIFYVNDNTDRIRPNSSGGIFVSFSGLDNYRLYIYVKKHLIHCNVLFKCEVEFLQVTYVTVNCYNLKNNR